MISDDILAEIIRIHADLRRRGLMRRRTRVSARPVNFWIETEPIRENGEIKNLLALTIIFGTAGCRWARSKTGGCIMCGYLYQNPAKGGDLLMQLRFVLNKIRAKRENIEVIKIFTSGSFLDDEEVPLKTRVELLKRIFENFPRLRLIEMETRPEFVTDDVLARLSELAKEYKVKLCLNIGLESANDEVLRLINKGFTSSMFFDAVRKAKKYDVLVKTYLLLKPPFFTEYDAIQDVVMSAKKAFGAGSYFISINPMVIFSWTFVEHLWRQKLYRPPTLESTIIATNEVLKLKEAKDRIVITAPVAPGSTRGPHALKKHSDRTLMKILDEIINKQTPVELPEENRRLWERYIEIEQVTKDLGMSEFRYQ